MEPVGFRGRRSGSWVTDALKPADVIIVLSGNSLPRAKAAARLFGERLAPRIIVSGGDANEDFELATGDRAMDAEITGLVLIRLAERAMLLTISTG